MPEKKEERKKMNIYFDEEISIISHNEIINHE